MWGPASFYRRVVLTHKFSLTLPLFIDVPVIIYEFIFVNQYLLTLMTDHDQYCLVSVYYISSFYMYLPSKKNEKNSWNIVESGIKHHNPNPS